jgi:hypothetical protein
VRLRLHRFTRFAIALLLVVPSGFVLGACGSAAAPDPYQLLEASTKATWDPLQVNVGMQIKAGSQSLTIDRSAIGMVVDSAGKKAAVHIGIPASDLGLSGAQMRALGLDASAIDLDMVVSDQAIFARGPLLAEGLKTLLGPDIPKGDLDGWLQIAGAADLAELSSLAAGLPSHAPVPSMSGSLKTNLEGAGISLSIVGTEKLSHGDAQHLKATVDGRKLLDSPIVRQSGQPAQVEQLRSVIDRVTFSGDLWIDVATSHLVEVDGHMTVPEAATAGATVTIVFADPDGSISTTPPAHHLDLPTKKLFQRILQMVAPGLPTA